MSDGMIALVVVLSILAAASIGAGVTLVNWPATIIGITLAIAAVAIGVNAHNEHQSEGKRKCRGCNKTEEETGEFALHYGESEGLCRKCLDEYLPLALKASKGKEEQK